MPTYLSFKARNWNPGLQMMFSNKGIIARYVCLKTTDLGAYRVAKTNYFSFHLLSSENHKNYSLGIIFDPYYTCYLFDIS